MFQRSTPNPTSAPTSCFLSHSTAITIIVIPTAITITITTTTQISAITTTTPYTDHRLHLHDHHQAPCLHHPPYTELNPTVTTTIDYFLLPP
ncbi:pollen-specific leucine-rich repeat extensin-like protein 4 [Iris pallida]|uniref:Pollen-specific leucine-rich repeat extensin-like protein 4 n=1 Tax=Iris pallida TaxID=29817 RepID=A0AAX6I8Y5_IRIPA|nr:pollen-specific leucine-rich repeat extensin-like protein 4 [Iris pallida]